MQAHLGAPMRFYQCECCHGWHIGNVFKKHRGS
jgi:hypothetical protein